MVGEVTNKTHARYFLLWALLAPIGAWLFQLVTSFLLAAYNCEQNLLWIHGVSLISLIISLSGQWTAFISGHYFNSENLKSYRFLSSLFLWLGILFTLTIIAQSLPNFTVEVCR
jgi:hypothetical protein